jgi:hypothetical protein
MSGTSGMSGRDERAPGSTVNTATDRELGYDRGLGVGYLDVAIDALVHLQQRTSPGRAWVVGDGAIEEVLGALTGWREELLRKEKTDARARQQEQEGNRPLPEAVPWIRGRNIRD